MNARRGPGSSLGHLPLAPGGKSRDATGAVVTRERHGKTVWRVRGKRGTDLGEHPIGAEIRKAERILHAPGEKVARTLRLLQAQQAAAEKAAAGRRARGDEARAKVLMLAEEFAAKNGSPRAAAAWIARRLKMTPRRVRQILHESGSNRKT